MLEPIVKYWEQGVTEKIGASLVFEGSILHVTVSRTLKISFLLINSHTVRH